MMDFLMTTQPATAHGRERDTDAHPAASDTLSLYLAEIGAVPLLSPEEEYALACRVKQGDEAAREHFVRANLRLVVEFAKRSAAADGADLLDRIQDGNLGLLQAVEHFDPSRGYKFSTYAFWWIRQAVCRGRQQTARLVRLPSYLETRLGTIARTQARLFEEHGCEPTASQIADALGLTVAQVEQAHAANVTMLSLDRPVSAHEEATLADCIADTRLADADEALCHEEEAQARRQSLESLLWCLTEREWAVIVLRFGLDSTAGVPSETRSLADVGRMLGICRERARQLEAHALTKLRQSAQALALVQTLSTAPARKAG